MILLDFHSEYVPWDNFWQDFRDTIALTWSYSDAKRVPYVQPFDVLRLCVKYS